MYNKPSIGHVPLSDGSWETIIISRGVRQGDSLGPAFFIVGLLPALEACRAAFPLVKIRSFYDDINITGPPDLVLQAYEFLLGRLAQIGLKLNPGKSRILAPHGLGHSEEAFGTLGMPTAETSMELLGTIIGSSAAILLFLDRKEREYVEALELIDFAVRNDFRRQVAFKLLRFCASARHLHLLRTIPPHLTKTFASRIQELSAKMIYGICHGFFVPDQPVNRPTDDPTCDKIITLPAYLGGLAMPNMDVLHLSEFVSGVRKSARLNAPNFDDFAELKLHYLDHFPQFDQACFALAELTNHTFSQADVDDIVASGANNLGSALANRVHETTAESLVNGMSLHSAVGHRSSRLPEAGTPFMFPYDYASRLDDGEFSLALLTRIVYPFFPGRVECKLCGLPADASAVHVFTCTKSTNKRTSNRHQGFQRAFNEGVLGNPHIDSTKFSLDTARPSYSELGTRTAIPLPAAAALNLGPSHLQSRYCYGDDLITLRTASDLTNGEKLPIDFTVAGLNAQKALNASLRSGALAEAAEKRKNDEVKRFWIFRKNVRFIPFAAEFMGGFGNIARSFLYELFDVPPPPSANADEHVAQRVKDERDAKFQALHRLKAAMTAAIWVGNHHIYQEYVHSLRAKLLQEIVIPESEDDE